MANPTLLVLVPTRGRPHTIEPFVTAWVASDPPSEVELVFIVDDDDPALDSYHAAMDEVTGQHKRIGIVTVPSDRMIGAVNSVAMRNVARFDAIGFLGDDCRVRRDPWTPMLEALTERPVIAYPDDGYQGENLPTHAFITTDVIEALGYMVLPDVNHCLIDVVWRGWGRAARILRYVPQAKIDHLHPYADVDVEWDEGYERVNNGAAIDRDALLLDAYMDSGRFDDDVEKLKGLK